MSIAQTLRISTERLSSGNVFSFDFIQCRMGREGLSVNVIAEPHRL